MKNNREGLRSRLDALEVVRSLYLQKREGAVESIRRIARSLWASARNYNLPELRDAASAVFSAQEKNLAGELDQLILTLKKVTSSPKEDKVSVLIVEDDPVVVRFLLRKLSTPDRNLLVAETIAEAQRRLEEHRVALIILDLNLPDMDGRNLLVHIRESRWSASIPVFVLSANTGAELKMECFALGADEYFEKPFDPRILAAAVSARLQRSEEIAQGSRLDVLTQLPNRVGFVDAFDRAQMLATRSNEPLCLAVIDLDGFKGINDEYGHAIGDQVLRQVALILSRSVRKSDFVARWGGDEFVALFPLTSPVGAVRALEKALHALWRQSFHMADGRGFWVTFSAGVAEIAPGTTLEKAFAEADRLLYMAKSEGRNRILSSEVSAPQ